jgi:voltage-gated sodium channel
MSNEGTPEVRVLCDAIRRRAKDPVEDVGATPNGGQVPLPTLHGQALTPGKSPLSDANDNAIVNQIRQLGIEVPQLLKDFGWQLRKDLRSDMKKMLMSEGLLNPSLRATAGEEQTGPPSPNSFQAHPPEPIDFPPGLPSSIPDEEAAGAQASVRQAAKTEKARQSVELDPKSHKPHNIISVSQDYHRLAKGSKKRGHRTDDEIHKREEWLHHKAGEHSESSGHTRTEMATLPEDGDEQGEDAAGGGQKLSRKVTTETGTSEKKINNSTGGFAGNSKYGNRIEQMQKDKKEELEAKTKDSGEPTLKKGYARDSINRRTAWFKKKAPLMHLWDGFVLEDFIHTTFFSNLVGGSIILNAAVLGIQTDWNAKNIDKSDDVPLSFQIVEQLFAAWFTFELLVRVRVEGLKFWKIPSQGWIWNWFDTVLVLAQLVEIFLDLALRGSSDQKQLRILRPLRALRLLRILRVLRVLHLISELRHITSSIAGSFKSLLWVVVLMFLMIYSVAVLFTQSVTFHLYEGGERSEDAVNLAYFFGGIGRSILSLWQAMSGGMDWDTLAAPLLDELGFLFGFAFVAFIAFAILALLNVVTGVFVQNAMSSARQEEDDFMAEQIIALFQIADKEGGTDISWNDIEASVTDPRTAKEWSAIGVEAEDASYLFNLLDVNQSGEISFEEFMGGALRLNGPAKAIDLLTVMVENRRMEDKVEELQQTTVPELIKSVNRMRMDVLQHLCGIETEIDVIEKMEEEIISGIHHEDGARKPLLPRNVIKMKTKDM